MSRAPDAPDVPDLPDVATVVRRLAASAPEIQRRLDDGHRELLARVEADLGPVLRASSEAGGDVARGLIAAVLPARPVISELNVEVTLALERARTADLEIGLRIGGRVVTSFLTHRYRSSSSARSRMSVTVLATPIRKPGG